MELKQLGVMLFHGTLLKELGENQIIFINTHPHDDHCKGFEGNLIRIELIVAEGLFKVNEKEWLSVFSLYPKCLHCWPKKLLKNPKTSVGQ